MAETGMAVVRRIRAHAQRAAQLAEQHQTPAVRAELATVPDHLWGVFMVALRYPDDDTRLLMAVINA
jgi:hypothetical protein